MTRLERKQRASSEYTTHNDSECGQAKLIVPLWVTASKVYDAVRDPVASVKVCGDVDRRCPPSVMDCNPSAAVKPIVPGLVVTGNEGLPTCEPAGSPLRAARPPSNTNVAAPPGPGILRTGVVSNNSECGVGAPIPAPSEDEAASDRWPACGSG